jgi:glycosyltransferase involved in cell wall biosynthesis
LRKAIPSCLQQDVVNREIILVDDCSSKPIEPDVMDLVRGNGIKLVRHDHNQGLSAARNTGIQEARNDWIVPLDADDWFYPNTVKALFDAKEGADVVTGNCTDGGVYQPAIGREPLSVALFKRENPCVCSSLFHKRVWQGAGGYTVRPGPHYEDWNFWAKAFAKGFKFKYLGISIYHHTSRPDSMLRVLHPRAEHFRKLATEGVF